MMSEHNYKAVIIDSRMYKESKSLLINMGYQLYEIPENDFFEKPVCAHPDMHLFCMDKIYASSFVYNLFTFENSVPTGREQSAAVYDYPNNVFLNCAKVGKNIICNKKYASPDIIANAEISGYNIINVKQGYAKCSTCVVSDNAVITEDDGILKACINNGIDALKISKGYVKLDGYDYGFIGGASGLIEDKLLAFNGDLNSHPDANKIIDFCSSYGVDVISLCNLPLYDVGSIYRLW